MKLFILHDNATWLKPIVAQLDALAVPFEAIDLGSGSVLELSAEPPAGLYFNRCSPSSHSRGKRYSMELAVNYIAWLEAHGRTVINGSCAVALEASKVLQELQLRRFGVPSPRTALACGREQLAPALVEEFSQLLGGKKFLTKHNRAGSGLGVRLFETAAQATEYVQSDGYEESVDGLTLLQSFVEAPEQALYRLEFVNGRFMYAVRVDTSHVKVAAKINNCPADSCQAKPGAAAAAAAESTPQQAAAADKAEQHGDAAISTVEDYEAAVSAARGVTVVRFTAGWCEACRRAQPFVDTLRQQYESAPVDFYVADESDELTEKFQIRKLPSYVIQQGTEGKAEVVTTVAQLAAALAAGVPSSSAKRRLDAAAEGGGFDNCPAPSASMEAPAKRQKTEAAKAEPLVGNCPMTASAAKFQIAPKSFGEEHRVLIAQLEALLRANDCAVSGVEVVFDAEGKGYVIDVNTCNTNYNVKAEEAAGVALLGSKTIARYLQTELLAVQAAGA